MKYVLILQYQEHIDEYLLLVHYCIFTKWGNRPIIYCSALYNKKNVGIIKHTSLAYHQ